MIAEAASPICGLPGLSGAREEQAVCGTGDRPEVTLAEALPADLGWKGEVLPLEPVDELPSAFIQNSIGTTFHLTAASRAWSALA